MYMRSRYEFASSSISVAPTSEAPGPSAAAAEAAADDDDGGEIPTRAARVGEETTASEKRRLRASGAVGGAEGEETKAGSAWEGDR